MQVAHLSDLHLRQADDVAEFARQLDHIVARRVDHLVIAGDLLDRWNPTLLNLALDALATRGLMERDTLTLIHGNHDLASSGGYPRHRADLWRLAARFWDPPPIVALRKRRFYAAIAARAGGVGMAAPWTKTTRSGLRVAAIDSVPVPWRPLTIRRGQLILRHAEGAIPESQTSWLSGQQGRGPLIVVMHHYPLPVAPFRWDASRGAGPRRTGAAAALAKWDVIVPMAVDAGDLERFWTAADRAEPVAVLCGHVHRARMERRGSIAIGLNGQSGADWAGRTIAYYRIEGPAVSVEYETALRAA